MRHLTVTYSFYSVYLLFPTVSRRMFTMFVKNIGRCTIFSYSKDYMMVSYDIRYNFMVRVNGFIIYEFTNKKERDMRGLFSVTNATYLIKYVNNANIMFSHVRYRPTKHINTI
jgi:hypothetical protein